MQIWYMNGAGNDFVVVDARNLALDFHKMSMELCAGYGADGFMAVDHAETADFKLHFYNADGSRGEMCGNGARCICRFAYENGIAGNCMTVETDAGIVEGERLSEDWYRVRLNLPGLIDLNRKKDTAYVELGNPGVPHVVKEIEGLMWEQRETLREMAKGLRYDAAFPKGANVNLYTWIGENKVRILTYERGVEDYTLACGTGSAAVAVVLFLTGKMKGETLLVDNPGGTLEVKIEGGNGEPEAIYLSGPTEVEKKEEIPYGGEK